MSKVENSVINYYDNYSKTQIKTGVNLRHRSILQFLIRAGLKRHHKVLEIGCGIGTVTGLLSKYLTKGNVIGIDISPESISIARTLYAYRKNIEFIITDAYLIKTDGLFDFVVMPDVLEHIPANLHQEIFLKIRNFMKESSVLFIHIPSPRYQEYLSNYQPDLLQIIDQAIEANSIIKDAEGAGFELIYFERYSLAIQQGDYQQIIFKVKNQLRSINRFSWFKMARKELISRLRHVLL